MRKSVIAILLVVVVMFNFTYTSASTMYDTYKKEVEKAEKVISNYQKYISDLQIYLDAVDSGDLEQWEKARNSYAFLNATMYNKDKKEVDAVRAQMDLYKSLLSYNKITLEMNKQKMNIYFNAYILENNEEINSILNNGNRAIPSDISGNIYYAWPYTEIPGDLFNDRESLRKYIGNIYLAPATVLERDKDDNLLIDIYGVKAHARICSNDNVNTGETVNIYFMPYGMRDDGTPYVLIGEKEETIDALHNMRPKDNE